MLVVIDTNILVSALWSKDGAPARVIELLLQGRITPCYDWRILAEYHAVLTRPKFQFKPAEITALLDWIKTGGRSVVAPALSIPFVDEDDKKFYEVARCCGATLITGNLKHFPQDSLVMGVQQFLTLHR